MSWTSPQLVGAFLLAPVLVWGVGTAGMLLYLRGSVVRRRRYYDHVQHTDPDDLVLPSWTALWREVNAMWRVALNHALRWCVPAGLWRHADAAKDSVLHPFGASRPPLVLCVHGLTQNGSNFRQLRLALQATGHPSAAISMGRVGRALPAYEAALTEGLRKHFTHTDSAVLVCHSMGGLVLRAVLQAHPDLRAKVLGVATLATPHAGTGATWIAPAGWLKEADAMRPGSQWLRDLPSLCALLPQAHAAGRLATFGSRADLVVYPPPTACCADIAHHVLPDIGHAGVMVDPVAVQAVLRWVRQVDAATG